MLRLLVVLLTALSFAADITPAQAQDVRPAGYIMAYELKGVDAEKRTVVVRKGAELAPKLLMPVYDGDSVFIRDEESRVVLSLAGEGSLIVTGKLMRKDVTGEMASGDDSFSIIEQIVSILIGDSEDDSFSVLVSKGGDAIKVPLAVRGRNYIIRSAEPVHLAWTGGEGPFTVKIGDGKPVAQDTREVTIAADAISGSRFAVTITDARKNRLRIAFELRKALPNVPDKIKARENQGEVAAVWLAGRDNGAWRFEALRQLRALPRNEMTAGLIAALEKGWLPRVR
ncbi:hypothetical protein G5V57_29905 [Nordella sp. HKS 07]|uniref:hypothetical protein n=1 Tax=Nordella sp. HKS 07 TaxID=2712222 RepID=UPI0013E15A53|nr:hypothetical protein [Nordella sp. HKS 07]QIG51558.1 hypothetical protein G5V57_29905 [Nordella sp. HKS 07]